MYDWVLVDMVMTGDMMQKPRDVVFGLCARILLTSVYLHMNSFCITLDGLHYFVQALPLQYGIFIGLATYSVSMCFTAAVPTPWSEYSKKKAKYAI